MKIEEQQTIKRRAAQQLSFSTWGELVYYVKAGHDIVTANPLGITLRHNHNDQQINAEASLISALQGVDLQCGFDDVGTMIVSAKTLPMTTHQKALRRIRTTL